MEPSLKFWIVLRNVFACLYACSNMCSSECCRVFATGRMTLVPGNGVPVAMENDEQSPEEAEQALAEALMARISSLDAQLAKLGSLKR